MPCYVTGSAQGDAELARDEAYDDANKATRAACEMAKILKPMAQFNRLSKSTQDWIKEHEKIDRQRKKEEAEYRAEHKKRKNALRKLSGR